MRRTAGGIFWGFTLILIGGLLLARNLGYDIRIWGYLARYWPVLLIVWGVLKLVDYYRFKNSDDKRPLFSGGEVALVVFVIFAGAAVTTAASISSNVGELFEIGNVDLWDVTGNNFTFQEHEETALPEDSQIEIVNFFGDVEVHPSDGDRALLDVKKTVRASSMDEAERLAKDFTFSITNEDGKYRIASNRDGILRSRQRYKSSLKLQLPKRSSLRVNNRNGKIEVADLAGNQDIVNRFGAVEVRNITGNVKVSNSFGRIAIRNVQGDAEISGRNNSIELQGIQGDVMADSSFQNVTIRGATGSIDVKGRNGDLLLSFDKPVQRDVQLTTNFGNVTVELPSNSSFRLDAHTQFGRINSDFQGLEKGKSDFARDSAQGQIGEGGPQIKISTFNGNIHLVRRS
jgi:DUF4097 and DUF4098 domain-containing protein YvlB